MSELDITTLLKDWAQGDREALEQLMPLVFEELRRVAAGYFDAENPGHTLQPTALVNEVFLRLVDRRKVSWENRSHFFGFAAQLMRRILVDHARGRKASKRGGGVAVAPLDEALAVAQKRDVDLIALDDALADLARIDPEGSRVVEMRFFAGLTHQEVAEVLGVPEIKVRRQWTAAKLWLFRQLKKS
ncbi:MAG: sigma-70 family RNA polymerase sigma factor [bacterium]|nr:sigma-70 family RNA polymerase sigma factor [bacterium]